MISSDSEPRKLPMSIMFDGDRTPESAAKYYDERAANYDKEVQACNYNGPRYAVAALSRHLEDKNALILSAGVGTGVEGVLLQSHGYTNLHACDASVKMIEQANKKGVFNQTKVVMFDAEKQSDYDTGKYDAVLCVGCFLPACLHSGHLPELLRLVRQGGLLIIGTQRRWAHDLDAKYNWPYNLDKMIRTMHRDGSIELVEEKIEKDWNGFSATENSEGLAYVIRKL